MTVGVGSTCSTLVRKGEPEHCREALAVEIEDAQIVGFMQIAQDDVEVPAIAFPCNHLEGDELVDPSQGAG